MSLWIELNFKERITNKLFACYSCLGSKKIEERVSAMFCLLAMREEYEEQA